MICTTLVNGYLTMVRYLIPKGLPGMQGGAICFFTVSFKAIFSNTFFFPMALYNTYYTNLQLIPTFADELDPGIQAKCYSYKD